MATRSRPARLAGRLARARARTGMLLNDRGLPKSPLHWPWRLLAQVLACLGASLEWWRWDSLLLRRHWVVHAIFLCRVLALVGQRHPLAPNQGELLGLCDRYQESLLLRQRRRGWAAWRGLGRRSTFHCRLALGGKSVMLAGEPTVCRLWVAW